MKEMARPALALCAICFCVTLMLAFVNQNTKDRIDANQKLKTEASLHALVPEADETIADPETGVITCFRAGDVIGYCVLSTAEGYGGTIEVLAAFTADGSVIGYEIIKASETPGLGANASNPDFIKGFAGKTPPLSVVKSGADSSQINALTGATVTSEAIAKAVNDAAEKVGVIK